jgi:hypothetical protein
MITTKGKRGDINFMMVMLIVILLVAAIILVYVGRVGKTTGEQISTATPAKIRAQLTTCKLGSQGFSDYDKDGYADYCDPCYDGPDNKQSDADFVADACDKNPTSTEDPEVACCGEAAKGKSLEEIREKNLCKDNFLVSVEPYFQCSTKNPASLT